MKVTRRGTKPGTREISCGRVVYRRRRGRINWRRREQTDGYFNGRFTRRQEDDSVRKLALSLKKQNKTCLLVATDVYGRRSTS